MVTRPARPHNRGTAASEACPALPAEPRFPRGMPGPCRGFTEHSPPAARAPAPGGKPPPPKLRGPGTARPHRPLRAGTGSAAPARPRPCPRTPRQALGAAQTHRGRGASGAEGGREAAPPHRPASRQAPEGSAARGHGGKEAGERHGRRRRARPPPARPPALTLQVLLLRAEPRHGGASAALRPRRSETAEPRCCGRGGARRRAPVLRPRQDTH